MFLNSWLPAPSELSLNLQTVLSSVFTIKVVVIPSPIKLGLADASVMVGLVESYSSVTLCSGPSLFSQFRHCTYNDFTPPFSGYSENTLVGKFSMTYFPSAVGFNTLWTGMVLYVNPGAKSNLHSTVGTRV